jgi:hypothetical protein
MTLEAQIAAVLRVGIALGLMLILFRCFCRYRLDAFRQSLFSLRNVLFNDALAGTMPFDHPAYRMTRDSINSLIRFAHHLNTIQLVLFLFVYRRHPEMYLYSNFDERLQKACRDLPKEAQERILFVRYQTRSMLLRYILPLLVLVWLKYRLFDDRRGNRGNIADNTGVRLIEYEAQISESLETSEAY